MKGKFLIGVGRHKTAKQGGVADVTVDPDFFEVMKRYSEFRKSLLNSKEMEEKHFISRKGTPLDSSSANSALQSANKVCQIRKLITAKIIRKCATTSDAKDPAARAAASTLMMNSEAIKIYINIIYKI